MIWLSTMGTVSAILSFPLLDPKLPIFSKSFADWRPAGARTGDER
jgi:hypothetical protein